MTDGFKILFEEKSANIIIKAVDMLHKEQASGNPFVPRFPDSYYSDGYFEIQMNNFQSRTDIDSLKSSQACAFVILEDDIAQKFLDFIMDNGMPICNRPSKRYQGITQYVKDEITVIEKHLDVHKEARKLFKKKEEKKVAKTERKTKRKTKLSFRRLFGWLLSCVGKRA